MFKASTFFIKEQIASSKIEDLIALYKREFSIQSSKSNIAEANKLDFVNNTFRFSIDRFSNKLSSFSNGHIEIADEGNEFVVYFTAQWTRLFTLASVIAGAIILTTLFNDGFGIFPFLFGLAVFIILVVIGYIYTIITFPVYFTSLRNRIERELQTTKT